MMATASNIGDVSANHGSDRTFGLDVCRALAALMVVCCHMCEHSRPHPFIFHFRAIGLYGVDLFFCLSGFLIGRILLAESKNWPENHEESLYRFWYRRWMRTLPLYLFYFVVSLKYDWRGATTLEAQSQYLVFAQNLAWKMPDFYRLSWSLAVEEWFYLTFPLVLLALSALGITRRRTAALAISTFIVVPFLFRAFLPSHLPDVTSFDEGIRSIVVFRLDAIGFGVLIAYLYIWHKTVFETLSKHWWPFALLVVACITYMFYEYVGLAGSVLLAPCFFLATAFAFAMLIPKFYSLKPTRFQAFNRFIKYTSKISYSLYLGHIYAFTFAIAALNRLHVFDSVYPNPWVTYPLFLALSFTFATATYYLIEYPVLALRDKTSRGAFHPTDTKKSTHEENKPRATVPLT